MKRTPLKRGGPIKRKSSKKVYRGSGPAPTDAQLHTLWAEIVKYKANHECQLYGCGGMLCGGPLNAHHIFKIHWRATRVNVENGLCCCYTHHIRYVHYDTTRAAMDILEIIGQERYDRLDAIHRQETKWTADDRRRLFQELSAELAELKVAA